MQPASKKRRRASPVDAPAASSPAPAASLADADTIAHVCARGRRRESGTGDEDDGEINEMLVALGIPNSDKKKQKQKQTEVIELITPPRAASRAPDAAAAVRFGARGVVPLDDDGDQVASADGERRRESIVDLTSPDATALESVAVVTSSSSSCVASAAAATTGDTVQRVRRTLLVATAEVEARELSLPASPVLRIERVAGAQMTSSPQTPSSDRECDAMLEDLLLTRLLTRPLAERISAARGRKRSSTSSLVTRSAVAVYEGRENGAQQVASSLERREAMVAQSGGFVYSSSSVTTTTTRILANRRHEGPTRPAGLAETLDFRMSESHNSENAMPFRTATREDDEGLVGARPQAAAGTPQKKSRAAATTKASGAKRESVVAVVKMERTLHDSEAGQVLKKALQTHVYNTKPLVYELGAAFDCMHSNVIQWERRELVMDRSRSAGGASKSVRSAASSSSAPSVCRFLSVAIYFQAEEFIELLEQGCYSEVRSIMRFLKTDLQNQATRLQQQQSRLEVEDEIQLSTFLIIEGMDKCLINRKKRQTTATTQPAVQVSQLSFSDIHEMAFQLFMDTKTHTKFTVDLDGTASYVAMLTREIVIAAAKKTAQEDFLESVPRLHSFRVMSTGATMNNFANSWLRMLQMIPGVSEDKAQSVLDHFPTFSSLMLAYSDPNASQAEKEDLLASKLSGKNIGRAISKKIFNVFRVDDPEAFI